MNFLHRVRDLPCDINTDLNLFVSHVMHFGVVVVCKEEYDYQDA